MKNNENITVGLDISKNTTQILKRAFSLAKINNSNITVVHAIDSNWINGFFSNINIEDLKQNAIEKIQNDINSLNTNGISYSIVVEKENPSSFIIDTAKNTNSSLIIIGENSKENFETKVFGTTAHKVAQTSNIPLLIIKNNYQNEYNNMVTFSDLSEVSLSTLNFANTFFNKEDIKVVSVYKQTSEFILRYYNNYEKKDEIQSEIKEKREKEFKNFVKQNNIKNALLIEESHNIKNALFEYVKNNNNDLVILGSRGINDSNSLLYGSTSSYLMENLDSDILIYVPKS